MIPGSICKDSLGLAGICQHEGLHGPQGRDVKNCKRVMPPIQCVSGQSLAPEPNSNDKSTLDYFFNFHEEQNSSIRHQTKFTVSLISLLTSEVAIRHIAAFFSGDSFLRFRCSFSRSIDV